MVNPFKTSPRTSATRESTSSLKRIETDSAAREEDLTRIIKQQTKRLTACAYAAIALATIAATVSVLALLR